MGKTGNKKILIVEDELALARVLHLKISGAGFPCEMANDGDTALKMIQTGEFALVLLDLILPGLDGFEIMEKIKDMKNKPMVIILSNLSQETDVTRAKELGAKEFFIKSDIQLVEIVDYLKKLLP